MQSQTASAHSVVSGAPAALLARLEALKARHAALSQKIEMEQNRPGTSDWYLRALKTQRLHLKEEIEEISGRS
jgi:hypothetical protein